MSVGSNRYLTLPQVAHLAGQNPATVWRQGKRGRFGSPVRLPGSTCAHYRRDTVEAALGRAFTDEQIAAARVRRVWPSRRGRWITPTQVQEQVAAAVAKATADDDLDALITRVLAFSFDDLMNTLIAHGRALDAPMIDELSDRLRDAFHSLKEISVKKKVAREDAERQRARAHGRPSRPSRIPSSTTQPKEI